MKLFGFILLVLFAFFVIFIMTKIKESQKSGSSKIIQKASKPILNEETVFDTASFKTTGEGRVMIGTVVERQVVISIAEYNATHPEDWELLDAYSKNNAYTTSWRNRETGEHKEMISVHSPSERLIIKDSKSELIETEKRTDKITLTLLSEEEGEYKYSVTEEIDGKTRCYVTTTPRPLLRPYVDIRPKKKLIIENTQKEIP